jgi:hypothetical protein
MDENTVELIEEKKLLMLEQFYIYIYIMGRQTSKAWLGKVKLDDIESGYDGTF